MTEPEEEVKRGGRGEDQLVMKKVEYEILSQTTIDKYN
jgi:hypothetical protein